MTSRVTTTGNLSGLRSGSVSRSTQTHLESILCLSLSQRLSHFLEVIYILDPEIEFICPIDYSQFPFHSYTCKLRLTSFNEYNSSVLFKRGHLFFAPKAPLSFILAKNADDPGHVLNPKKIKGYTVRVGYLTGRDTVSKAWGSDNYFSTTGLEIHLKSRYSKYIFIYFIPTTMFTFTSWVSYLIPPTSYPARTTLLVTVFLCQV